MITDYSKEGQRETRIFFRSSVESIEDRERKWSLLEYKNKIHEFKVMDSIYFAYSYYQFFYHINIFNLNQIYYKLLGISPSIQDYTEVLIYFKNGQSRNYQL